MANEVFISYSRKDYEIVRKIKAEIDQGLGIYCWMDLDGIESGDQFKKVIISAINRHEIVLFMKSLSSMNSEYSMKEITFAKNKKKRIVLIDLDHSSMTDEFLFDFGNIDIIDWEDDLQKEKLLRNLKTWTNKNEVEQENLSIQTNVKEPILRPYESDGKWGFIDLNTRKVIIPPQWKKAWEFTDGLAAVEDDNEQWGFIDKTGKVVVPCKWDFILAFSEGLAVVGKNFKYGFIDKTGKVVIPCKWDYIGSFSEGLAAVRDENFKYGFIDKTGKVAIPCKWGFLCAFSEGLAAFGDGNKWGYIDKTGKPVMYCKWKYCFEFHDGLAAVSDENNKWGFIDKTGKLVINCKWKNCWWFSDGLAAVEDDNEQWGYIDKTGNLVIPYKWKSANLFMDGFAIVSDENREYLIDKTGKIVC